MHVEDDVPETHPAEPEQVLESPDLQHYITHTLATLPRPLRLAFVLRHVEGLPAADVAKLTGQPESEIERNVEQARRILRQRLADAGLAADDESAARVFGTAPSVKVTTALRRTLKKEIGTDSMRANAARAGDVTP